MGNWRPVKTSCWVRFLKSKGCKYKSTEASHDKWRCAGCTRSIIFRGKDKDIPSFHIEGDLKTMGIPKLDFWDWVKENC